MKEKKSYRVKKKMQLEIGFHLCVFSKSHYNHHLNIICDLFIHMQELKRWYACEGSEQKTRSSLSSMGMLLFSNMDIHFVVDRFQINMRWFSGRPGIFQEWQIWFVYGVWQIKAKRWELQIIFGDKTELL